MYVDAVVLNKIKIYFKTSQIHYVFCFYTFLIIKSSLLLFEGPYTEKSWQSVFSTAECNEWVRGVNT